MAISKKYLHIFHTVRSGDGTARLWPINETGIGTPIILRHQFKDLENHKNTTKDITCLEWNVSCALSFYPCFASLVCDWATKTCISLLAFYALWWRANAQSISFATLYCGQFTFSTQFIKPNYLVVLPYWRSTAVSLETYPLFAFHLQELQLL